MHHLEAELRIQQEGIFPQAFSQASRLNRICWDNSDNENFDKRLMSNV